MAWLQIEAGTRDHPKILKLARDCHVTVAHACGTITLLWLWTLTHAPDGDLSSFDWEDIELAAGWDGEPGIWYKSAVARKLIDETAQGAQIHDWEDYTSSWKEAQRAKEYRAQKGKRSARVRDNAALSHDSAPDRPTDQTDHNTLPDEFETEFWPNVPVKVDKKKARAEYLKARKSVAKEIILAGLPVYQAKERQRARSPDYQAHSPFRWLRDARWTDEIPGNGQPRHEPEACACGCGRKPTIQRENRWWYSSNCYYAAQKAAK